MKLLAAMRHKEIERELQSTLAVARGITGSIGWAQYLGDEAVDGRHKGYREKLHRRLRRLMPYQVDGNSELGSLGKRLYRLHRFRVPRRRPDAGRLFDALLDLSCRP